MHLSLNEAGRGHQSREKISLKLGGGVRGWIVDKDNTVLAAR